MTAIAALLEGFEGTENHGDAITTGNTIYDAITGSGTSTFTTTDPFEGSKACQVTVAAQNRSLEASFTSAAVVWFGFALRVDDDPSAVTAIVNSYSAGTLVGNLRLNADRTLQFRDSATSRWTSTEVLTVGDWYQIRLRTSPTADTAQVKIYDAAGVELEDSGSLTLSVAAATSIDEFRMGLLTGNVTGSIAFDSLMADDADEPPVYSGTTPYLYYDTGTAWVEAEGLYYDNGTTWDLVEPGVPTP